MLTIDEAPWAEYLEIDEETWERKLREDTPKDIREKYEQFLQEQNSNPDELIPK